MLVKVDEDFFEKLMGVARGIQNTRAAVVANKNRLGQIRGGRILIGIDATFEELVKVMADLDPDYFRERLGKLIQEEY